MSRDESIRLVIEICGAAALCYGSYLLAPWLGWVIAGVILMLWSFGVGQAIEKAKKDTEGK